MSGGSRTGGGLLTMGKDKGKGKLPEHLELRRDFVTCGDRLNFNVSAAGNGAGLAPLVGRCASQARE